MPICLPHADKFPDEAGIVYAAGWGLNHESTKKKYCITGKNGPDPFSKCKFPFYIDEPGSIPFSQCLESKSPSAKNKGCKELYNLMMKRKGNTNSFLEDGRVNASTYRVIGLKA